MSPALLSEITVRPKRGAPPCSLGLRSIKVKGAFLTASSVFVSMLSVAMKPITPAYRGTTSSGCVFPIKSSKKMYSDKIYISDDF
jgi:hypothetical protein